MPRHDSQKLVTRPDGPIAIDRAPQLQPETRLRRHMGTMSGPGNGQTT